MSQTTVRVETAKARVGITVKKETPTMGITVVRGESVPKYTGTYEVIPQAWQDVSLETAGKKMEQDVTVHKIPYYETSNPQGGMTVYIGGEE
jgi:hypothetical protein